MARCSRAGSRPDECRPAFRPCPGRCQSGRQATGDGPSGDQDDGILTSEEIGTQNLDGVQLVMLSACETGLGKSAAGEGLLGLQRAFQSAGARTVVASLWSVPDDETRALMETFYTNLWQKHLTPLESLRQAQLAMLRGTATAGRQRGFIRTDVQNVSALRHAIPLLLGRVRPQRRLAVMVATRDGKELMLVFPLGLFPGVEGKRRKCLRRGSQDVRRVASSGAVLGSLRGHNCRDSVYRCRSVFPCPYSGRTQMRSTVLAMLFVFFTAITGQFTTAQEKQSTSEYWQLAKTKGPDTVVGRWVVDSIEIDGKKATAGEGGFSKGVLFKFNSDGTGNAAGKKNKWSYDKETRTLTVTEEGVLWGWKAPYDYDVTKDGENIVLGTVLPVFMKPIKVTLKPEDSAKRP